MSGSLLSICDIRRSTVFVDVIVLLLFQREIGSVNNTCNIHLAIFCGRHKSHNLIKSVKWCPNCSLQIFTYHIYISVDVI